MARTGYVNGSDMLLYVAGDAIGHCTSHTTTYTSDTKERAVKPAASVSGNAGLFKDRSVAGLSISISFEGLRFYDEDEAGMSALLTAWKTGQPVTVKGMRRSEGSTDTPTAYIEGSFVISSLEEAYPAGDDATYRGQLENNGAPTTFTPANIE